MQEVLAGLDDQQISSAVEQPARLRRVRSLHVQKRDVSQRRQLCRWPHRTRYPTRLFFRRKIRRHALCKLRGFDVQLISHVRDLIFGEHDRCAAKRIRLDHVAADFQKSGVHVLDCNRLANQQMFRAAFKLRTAVIVHGKVLCVQICAHRAVKDDDAIFWNV